MMTQVLFNVQYNAVRQAVQPRNPPPCPTLRSSRLPMPWPMVMLALLRVTPGEAAPAGQQGDVTEAPEGEQHCKS